MNPQLENGYIRIASEIVDQFASLHLSGGEWQIIWVVLRKTYGWNKKEDSISLTQFEKTTGLSRPSVCEALNKLVKKNILLVNKTLLAINSYSFNKAYSKWVVRKSLPSKVFGRKVVRKTVLGGSKENGTHNIQDIKDNITKDITAKAEKNLNHPYKDIINYCKEKQNLSNGFVNYAKQTTAVKKILLAGYKIDDIRFVIDEMSNEPFWQGSPFDLMGVANQMHKYMNRTIIFKKGGDKNAKYQGNNGGV